MVGGDIEPYPEEGNENRMMGGAGKRKAIPGSLIDKCNESTPVKNR